MWPFSPVPVSPAFLWLRIFVSIVSATKKGGGNESSSKSYDKAERSMNDAAARIWGIRSLWIAINMRQF